MLYGVWRSLVAHLHGVQRVGGSNPLTPTKFEKADSLLSAFFMSVWPVVVSMAILDQNRSQNPAGVIAQPFRTSVLSAVVHLAQDRSAGFCERR